MKKLMMAVAIVCAAACAQAGYVTWSAANVKYSGTALSTGHTYAFFFTSESDANDAWDAFQSGMTLTAFNSLVDDASWDDSKKATAAGNFGIGTTSATGGYTINDLSNASFGLSDTTKYYAFLVLTDKDSVSAGDHYTTTQVLGQSTAGSSNTGANFAFGNQLSQATTRWQTITVPEPTSGLLLLLGMAGLALRRRRA